MPTTSRRTPFAVPPERFTATLKALADESRLRLLKLLAQGATDVSSLAGDAGLTVYNTSRHLRLLKEAGLVEMDRAAQQRIYRLADTLSKELKENGKVLDLGCCSFRFADFPE
jgi:DNA-binding transcriptional ArsR family regulator